MKKNVSLVSLFGLVLAACGGGGGDAGAPGPLPLPSPAPSTADRSAAATSTAQNNSLCTAVRPFYWEIGDGTARLASGTVGGAAPTSSTAMAIASASKWIYGAYVVQLRSGGLTAADVQFLTFRSGYSQMAPLSCGAAATIDTCLGVGTNGVQDPASIGKFFYNGGHMQRHAHDIGLGSFTSAAFTTEVQSKIGDFGFIYASPQPPGGINTSADGYAAFLRTMLRGELQIAAKLGTSAVCTNPTVCPDAAFTPIPSTESWHYSIGHWVEDDPAVGDGAFSSAGAFGFYPWIDRTKTWYGVLARQVFGQEVGYESAKCGRLIRKAWVTATAQ